MRGKAEMVKNKFINWQQIKQIEDALYSYTRIIRLDELGRTFVVRLLMRIFISPEELSFVARVERRTTEDYLSRWIMRFAPVLETHNPA